MRGGSKTLLAALVALVLGMGLVACGGGDDSGSTSTEAQRQAADAAGNAAGAPSKDGKEAGSDEGTSGGGDQSDSTGEEAGDFVPKQHEDSGGGSEQFRVKGGDNSVQEFGEEADDSEREEAATALHNFLDARAEAHWAAACEYLASSIVESLGQLTGQKKAKPSDCAGILRRITNPAAKTLMREEAEQADVGSLRLEDGRAFVIYRGTEGDILAMPMSQEGGDWKVASLAGTPLN